jgi:ribonuclease J
MKDKGFCMFIRAVSFFEEPLTRFADRGHNLLIYSMWEGYLQKDKSYTDPKLITFIERAKENGCRVEKKHTSGHAYEEAIIEVCGIIKPEVIIPIHSENPDKWEELAQAKMICGKVKRLEHKECVDPIKIIMEGEKHG